MSVLVVVEQSEGAVRESTLEAITLARGLGAPVEAAVLGTMGTGVIPELQRFGVSHVHDVEHEILSDYSPEAWGEAVAQLLDTSGASALMAAGTDVGNEVLAQVAARRDLPMAANCTAITPGSSWEVTRTRWGGILLEDACLTADVKVASVAPISVRAVEAPLDGELSVEQFTPELGPELARTRVVERTTLDTGISLATAPLVVSGRRGVGSAEGFAILEELAEQLGGTVGCSRVATNNGWRSHSDQVGQTGTRISPELYIACGISGATQHWAGCMGSKKILAINKDADAPLVQRADYAVLGDLHEVLPAVLEEVRRRKNGD
jgi:electron transfer flavoprotein alpha subunit